MATKYTVIRPGKVHELRNLTGILVICPECDNTVTITGEVQKMTEWNGFVVNNMYSNAFFEITVENANEGHFLITCKECGCGFKVENIKE